ncbi:MAG: hypothetical protein J6B99_03295 [Oscillospiraceae bacterium]|nr:hypothetical protein [Oscillospiraceae bacterium]
MNDQKFEQWLRQALATDVTAPEDFTARVMDRVSAMPQEYPKKNPVDKRKLKRMMTALAACAAIVVLIPVGLMMMPMGKSAPAADCAAPEMAMDDAAADTEFFVEDAYNDAAGLERMEEQEAPDTAPVAPADDGMTDGGEAEVQTTSDERQNPPWCISSVTKPPWCVPPSLRWVAPPMQCRTSPMSTN